MARVAINNLNMIEFCGREMLLINKFARESISDFYICQGLATYSASLYRAIPDKKARRLLKILLKKYPNPKELFDTMARMAEW